MRTYFARGEVFATFMFGKSAVPDSKTGVPGMNLRLFGFGVSWVWMNIVLRAADVSEQKVNTSLSLAHR